MKKILVCDYDDTFHITREGLSENIEAVQKFRDDGNMFIIATGRGFADFKWVREEFGVKYDMLILDHGALILDGDDNIIFSSSIPDNIVMEIKDDLRLENTRRVFCTSGFVGRAPFDAGNIQKINVWYNEASDAKEVLEIVQQKYGNVVNAYLIPSESIEMITKDSGKEIAIEWLCGRLGISTDNVYTAGDGYTDIKMIKKYKGYAVPNAVEPLKEAACGIVESVSKLIEKISNNEI